MQAILCFPLKMFPWLPVPKSYSGLHVPIVGSFTIFLISFSTLLPLLTIPAFLVFCHSSSTPGLLILQDHCNYFPLCLIWFSPKMTCFITFFRPLLKSHLFILSKIVTPKSSYHSSLINPFGYFWLAIILCILCITLLPISAIRIWVLRGGFLLVLLTFASSEHSLMSDT